MLVQLQYHKDTLIDVRHILDGDEDKIPRGPNNEPKPWGNLETAGDFRIEQLQFTDEQLIEWREASVVGAVKETPDLTDDQALLDYILTEKSDTFKADLKTALNSVVAVER